MSSASEKAAVLYSKAVEAEHTQRDYKKALALYNQANDYLMHILKYSSPDERTKQRTCEKIALCTENIKKMKYLIFQEQATAGEGDGGGEAAAAAGSEGGKEKKESESIHSSKDEVNTAVASSLQKVDLTATAMGKGIDLVKKATEADNGRRYNEALPLYKQAIDYFLHALKYEASGPRSRESIRAKCAQYLERAEQLKRYLNKSSAATISSGAAVSYSDALKRAIVTEKPNVHWDDIAGLHNAKEPLKEAIILPIKFPRLFQTKSRQPDRGILLYGPPGTGKTYLAKAVATEAGSSFYSVNFADISSMCLKDRNLLMRLANSLFVMARSRKPAIIFLDEVESLDKLPEFKTEFFVQMQRSDNDGLTVLGATNTPWSLDSATRRRFEKRIYIPLPEADARMRMFQIHIGTMKTLLTDQDYQTLAQKTEGYSGADIGVLVREAVMMPVRKIQTATHFKVVSGPSPNNSSVMRNDLLVPCKPGDPGAMEMSYANISEDRLMEPPVTIEDFLQAITNAQRTIFTSGDLKLFEDWTKQFGQEG